MLIKTTDPASRSERGFTLVELLLAMAYLGVILMFTTLVTIQILATYNKGVSLKQINQVARTLTEDMTRVSNSGSTASFQSGDGFMCIGDTAYLWNTPDRLRDDNGDGNPDGAVYRLDNGLSGKPLGLVKTNMGVRATAVAYDVSKGNMTDYCTAPNIAGSVIDSTTVTELTSDQVRVLEFTRTTPANNARLAKIQLALGTYNSFLGQQATPIKQANGRWQCQPSSVGDFCAASNFETTVYVPNG